MYIFVKEIGLIKKGIDMKMKKNNGNSDFKTSIASNNTQCSQIDADEDAQIDLSEMPEWTDEMFKTARVGHYHIPQELKDRIDKITS